MNGDTVRCIGLMSGTSIDGVDGALVEFDHTGRLSTSLALASLPMPDALRDALTRLQQPGDDELNRAARAANALADLYADCVDVLLADSGLPVHSIDAIGAHGQTVRHDPAAGYTIQLLNAARLAERTGIDVIADLRSADIAAGGQGAPLVPTFHARVFGSEPGGPRRGIVNIGGIANLSVLTPPANPGTGTHPPGSAAQVIGFDTGPGNTLLDTWCEQHLGSRYDADGQWAAGGQVNAALLDRLLADPYFHARWPKSTGRDYFNLTWLARVGAPGKLDPQDVQATLLALTARTIADAVRASGVEAVFVCGGGALNGTLMKALTRELGTAIPVTTTGALNLAPMAVEATAFAWLARQHLAGEAGNLESVTGSRCRKILGARYPRS